MMVFIIIKFFTFLSTYTKFLFLFLFLFLFSFLFSFLFIYLFLFLKYESWKVREMRRLMRDAEQREFAALEKADLERRRSMTDEQRISEDKRLGESEITFSFILIFFLFIYFYFFVEVFFYLFFQSNCNFIFKSEDEM